MTVVAHKGLGKNVASWQRQQECALFELIKK